MKLLEKIGAIRSELDYMQKDTKGYNYKYVSGFSILSKITAKMNELKLILYPEIDSQTSETVNTLTKTGQKTEVIVSSLGRYVWLDIESGETLKVGWGFVGMQADASQAFGSGLTYAERYFLLKFFNVPTDEADPDKIRSKQQAKEEKEVKATLEQMKVSIDNGFAMLKYDAKKEAEMRKEFIINKDSYDDYAFLLDTLRKRAKGEKK